ncbi:hypothetical protein JST97_36285 [bacterium]|nr:hypothetical protein [bacterium]
MRKLDLFILTAAIATGAFWFQPRQSPPAPVHPLAAYQFAGLHLGDSPGQVRGVLGEPSRQEASNWFYESPAGVLDLYWQGGRLGGIQLSIESGKSSETRWALDPALPMGCSRANVRSVLGEPGRVRHGEVLETWNYAAHPGEPATDLALGFDKDRLLHVRMSLI